MLNQPWNQDACKGATITFELQRERRQVSSRRLLKLGLPVLAVLGVAAGAWAYWTTQGTGSASANVGTLNAPTNVSVPSTASGARPRHLERLDARRRRGAATGYYVTPDQEQRLVDLERLRHEPVVAYLVDGTSC